MKKILKCPLCYSKRISFLLEGSDKMHGIPGKFKIWRCKNCSLVFLNPRPTLKELERYYPVKYDAYAVAVDKKPGRLAEFLYGLYFNPGLKGAVNSALKRLFYPLSFFLRGTVLKRGAKLLDVGCGSGAFLLKMRRFGLNCYGIEPSHDAVNAAKKNGLKVFAGTLDSKKFPKGFFDVIALNHVLEHVQDPVKTLKECNRILGKSGKLLVGVPNVNSITFGLFGSDWFPLDAPRHLHNFSPKTMHLLAEKTGFKIVKIRFSSTSFFADLEYFLNRFRKKRVLYEGSKLAHSKWLGLAMNIPLSVVLSMFGTGDGMELLLEKQ